MDRFHNQRVLVWGLGKSGFAAMDSLLSIAKDVIAVDEKPRWKFSETAQKTFECWEATGRVKLQLADVTSEVFEGVTSILLSPGVNPEQEIFATAKERGIPFWNEAGLGLFHRKGQVSAITGSAGKTTTTTLVDRILTASGIAHQLGGNIGTPLLALDPSLTELPLVAELSSYQIEWLQNFPLWTGAFTTLVEDHLDRYGTMESYFEAKARLIPRGTFETVWLLNPDNIFHARLSMEIASTGRGSVWWYRRQPFSRESLLAASAQGIFWDSEARQLVPCRIPLAPFTVPEYSALDHSLENFMVAALTSFRAGASHAAIQATIEEFRGAPHRLEFVAEKRGVRFFNDSKATNTASVLNALRQFQGKRVIWLAGGKDKGIDFTPLVTAAREKCAGIIAFGEARTRLRTSLEPHDLAVTEIADLHEAVQAAYARAQSGDIVLLSPACASQDRFQNYEERGEAFKAWVSELA